MFIKPDDRLIIMDDLYNRLEAREIEQLAAVGVGVVYAQGFIRWRELQPNENDEFNFAPIDNYIETAHKYGLRVLMPFVHSIPDWFPPEWYHTRTERGKTKNIFRYDCEEAGRALDYMAQRLIDRYGGDDFELIYAYPADGEFPTHFWPTSPHIEYSHHDFVRWVYNRQIVLERQHHEIWTAYHPYTGPDWWKTLYDSFHMNFQFVNQYHICFTYWPHEGIQHVKTSIGGLQGMGVGCFVGSEWTTGLRSNMAELKRRRLRGFITCPIHFSLGYPRLSVEHLETIAWALEELSNE